MTILLLRGDARALPLADDSVDLIVTSPPYWALRSYTDGCPTCEEIARANQRGYMERYCPAPGCGQIMTTNVSPCHSLTTLRTEATKAKLREKCPDCSGGRHHYSGQIGSEASPEGYIAQMLVCTREWMRVLKPTGSLFVNLGDKYSNGGRSSYDRTDMNGERGSIVRPLDGARPKSLLQLPARYSIACQDQLDLIVRAEIQWCKPNGLPESVRDRVARQHEVIYHFTKNETYFDAVHHIREQTQERGGITYASRKAGNGRLYAPGLRHTTGGNGMADHPLGKLPSSWWVIATQPLIVPAWLGEDHYAAFPMELPRRIIRGWCPNGICTACGSGRFPVAQQVGQGRTPGGGGTYRAMKAAGEKDTNLATAPVKYRKIVGYACDCTPFTIRQPDVERTERTGPAGAVPPGASERQTPGHLGDDERVGPWREYHFDRWTPPPTRPAVVLDPFGGTGTTAMLAHVLGHTGISVDMSASYNRIAKWRTTDRAQMADAMQVKRPEKISDDQESLFSLEEAGA